MKNSEMLKPKRKRQKLSDVIVESVKRSIVTEALHPGDRLPTERELMEHFECSKGTAREALKALEVEGLVSTRTGPTGGAYLNEVGTEPASRALRNYLHFQHLDGEQVYQLRKVIEVELAGFEDFGTGAVPTEPLDDVFRANKVQQLLRLELPRIEFAQSRGNFQPASHGAKEVAVSDSNLNSVALFA